MVDLSPEMSTMRFKRYFIAYNLESSHGVLAWTIYPNHEIQIERNLRMFDQLVGVSPILLMRKRIRR